MGVTGLWRLVEPAGKPVPVETLENKVLAIDISIWLHQVVKGYQDAKGAPLPNAHLIGLFQRLCKLLYFRIKPVFVFDGAFPALKKETIAKRQDSKNKYHSESERLKRELAVLLGKKTAIGSLLGKQISPTKKGHSGETTNNDDLFKLPALPQQEEPESESEDEEDSSSGSIVDLHSVDLQSDDFKNMPAKEKYDLLIELKETRKMNSWGKLHTLPKKSDSFSDFQMERLLKRRKVQECLEETEKEMGDVGMSLNDLESLLNDKGIDTKIESLPTRRIASNNNTRYLLISNVREALAKAKERTAAGNKPQTSKETTELVSEQKTEESPGKKDELEDDLQKAIQMSLECADDSEPSAGQSKTDDSWTSILTDTDYSAASDSEGELEEPDVSTAKAYIMQYSDYTHEAIEQIVAPRIKSRKSKSKQPKVNQILEELNKEQSVIVGNVELSSSDEELTEESIEHSKPTEKDEMQVDAGQDELGKENLESTQASVMFVENTEPDVISLDSSLEEAADEKKTIDSKESINIKDSESSDGEFEEVPEVEDKLRKPVIELTLNIDKSSGVDDDIFADVFAPKSQLISSKENSIVKEIESKNEGESLSPKNEPLYINKTTDENKIQVTGEIVSNKIDSIKNILEVSKDSVQSDPTSKPIKEKVSQQSEEETVFNAAEIKDNAEKMLPDQKETSDDKVTDEKPNDKIEPVEPNKKPVEQLTTEKLNSMVEEIQNEEQDLIQEKGRLDRIGRNITEQMTKEAQELLQIFGIPYIVAPMEAEAQCAFLESVKLTDGTITDDSDIWLFGGHTVYKNFFNQKKHVLQYVSERIERSFNLTREQLILLALLVGSDYTTGVAGVGPVTAMEILASFPYNKKQVLTETSKQLRYAKLLDGLKEFKLWVKAGKRTDNTSLKKKLRNVTLSDDFPSMRVVQAYLEPNVERSEEKFTWGEVDVTVLRDYAKSKFGWSQHKFDEIINPVLARMQNRKNQRTVHDYFQRKVEFHTLEDQMSKRVKAAVQKLGPEGCAEEILNEGETTKPTKRRKKVNTGDEAGPSKPKQRKKQAASDNIVKIVSEVKDGKSGIEINIPKTERFQEIIPQREKDKQHLLENKLRAIEVFRKAKIDRKQKPKKKRANLPKEKADLSESSSSD